MGLMCCGERSVGGDDGNDSSTGNSNTVELVDADLVGIDVQESPCDLGLTLCGDLCADLQQDEVNCGICGYSCGDLTCSNGRCVCYGSGPEVCAGLYDDCYEPNDWPESSPNLSLGTTSGLRICQEAYSMANQDTFGVPPGARYMELIVAPSISAHMRVYNAQGDEISYSNSGVDGIIRHVLDSSARYVMLRLYYQDIDPCECVDYSLRFEIEIFW